MADLIQKLFIKPATHVAIINPPEAYVDKLTPLEDSITVRHVLKGTFDFIQIFVTHRHELDEMVTGVINSLKKGGVFWLAFPKTDSQIETNLSEEILSKEMHQFGFKAVETIDIDHAWRATRFSPLEESEEEAED